VGAPGCANSALVLRDSEVTKALRRCRCAAAELAPKPCSCPSAIRLGLKRNFQVMPGLTGCAQLLRGKRRNRERVRPAGVVAPGLKPAAKGNGRCESGDPARTMHSAWPKAPRQIALRTRIRPKPANEPD
jgi:hypothetical protein